MRIAVVGAGITGLSAAWLISKRHDVTLFEAAARPGGHSNTVDVETPDGSVAIDTGFIVYNPPAYPNLVAMFAHLGVPTADSNMSFAVSLDGGGYEYSGTGLSGFFGQRRNVLSPGHWLMAADILRFHKEAAALCNDPGADHAQALGAWLCERRYSRRFIDCHILPMAAAIWSAPADEMLAYPAVAFARFFANHQLLQASGHPIWRTVRGGSRVYVEKLLADFRGRLRLATPVVALRPDDAGVTLITQDGHQERFDRVAVCCHADVAARMLDGAGGRERSVLGAFRYARNKAVLHHDAGFMPRRRAVWSSWNYVARDPMAPLTVTYWMNLLQPLATGTQYFVTLNPNHQLAPGTHIATFAYAHPLFDTASLRAQSSVWNMQGERNMWFGGAWCGSGFHEDGLQAGLAIAEHMTRDDAPVRRPWSVENENARMALPSGILTVGSPPMGERTG